MGFWGGQSAGSALGFPVNTSLVGTNKSLAQELTLPQRVNAQQAAQMIQKASEEEGINKARSYALRAQQRMFTAYAQRYDQDAQFAQSRMQAAERMAQTDQKFGKAVMNHALAMGIQKAEVAGYESAMQLFS